MVRQAGFSLIELMIVLAVLGIGAAFAVPAFTELFESNRLAATTNSLSGFLGQARSEAVQQVARVQVEPRTGSDWAGGVVAWIDRNGDGTRQEEEIFRELSPLPRGFALTQAGGMPGFRASGQAWAASTLTLCPGPGKPGRMLDIAAGGRVRVTEITCS